MLDKDNISNKLIDLKTKKSFKKKSQYEIEGGDFEEE